MAGFSKEIRNFLTNIVDLTPEQENIADILQPIGKSLDSISPGDILIIRYVETDYSIGRRKLRGDTRGSRPQRAIMVVNPPTPIIQQRSSGRPGKIYSRKINYGSGKSWYVNSPMSGSKHLIPCVDLDVAYEYTLEDLNNLYINRRELLPSENYRSYKWQSMYQISKVKL